MQVIHGNGLAMLRRRRRGVCSALLPVFALWALTAPACFAQLDSGAEPTSPVAAHPDHWAGESARHGAAHQHSSVASAPEHCPHCPPATGTDASPSLCVGATTTASAPLKSPVFASSPLVVPIRFAPLLSEYAPAARHFAALDTSRYRAHVPLNIRHCVLLI
jgi:hypothetical protein